MTAVFLRNIAVFAGIVGPALTIAYRQRHRILDVMEGRYR